MWQQLINQKDCNCAYCGNEIPKGADLYDDDSIGICRDCYENGVEEEKINMGVYEN